MTPQPPWGTFGAAMSRIAVAFCALLLTSGCAREVPISQATPVDLTHAFGTDTLYWPTDEEGFVHETLFAGHTSHGWYAAGRLRSAEHGGTHLDAPLHFAEGGHAADEVPLARLLAPARVIDFSAAAKANPDHGVSAAEVEAHEAVAGAIPAGTIVLLRTDWSLRWPDRERYLGTARTGAEAVKELHFPGLAPSGARLLAERGVAAVGIDTASIDPGPSVDFRAHRVLAQAGIPIFENVANLKAVPEKGATVVALPMKIRGGSGGPLRIIALVP